MPCRPLPYAYAASNARCADHPTVPWASLCCQSNRSISTLGDAPLPRPHCLESFGHSPPPCHARVLWAQLPRTCNPHLIPCLPACPPAPAQVLVELKAAAEADPALRFPKLLYTVPTGQNPTGCTIPSERRRAVYRLCQQYDLLLVEDDPYFFLHYPSGPGEPPLPAPLACAAALGSQLNPGYLLCLAALRPSLPPHVFRHPPPQRTHIIPFPVARRLCARPARPGARRQLPQPGHRGARHPRGLVRQVHGARPAPGLGGCAAAHHREADHDNPGGVVGTRAGGAGKDARAGLPEWATRCFGSLTCGWSGCGVYDQQQMGTMGFLAKQSLLVE